MYVNPQGHCHYCSH